MDVKLIKISSKESIEIRDEGIRYKVAKLGERDLLILDGFYSLFRVSEEKNDTEKFIDLVIRLHYAKLLYENDMKLITNNMNMITHPYFHEKFLLYIEKGGHISDLCVFIRSLSVLDLDVFKVDLIGEKRPKITYPVVGEYSKVFIISNRRRIYNEFLLDDDNNTNDVKNISTITPPDVEKIYKLYSKYFFENTLPNVAYNTSTRMTSCSAVYSYSLNSDCNKIINQKITVSIPVIFNAFSISSEPQKINGLMVYDWLEAVQCSIEHEIVHLILANSEYYLKCENKKDRILKSHGVYFKQLAHSYFGHTDFKHQLLHNPIDKANRCKKEDFSVSNKVKFYDKNLTLNIGIITEIRKNCAKIIAVDGKNHSIKYEFILRRNPSGS